MRVRTSTVVAPTRAGRALAVAGALAATLAAAGCGYDRDAYCSAVREVRQPAELTGPAPADGTAEGGTGGEDTGPATSTAEDDAAVRAYLSQVRTLEDLAPRRHQGDWRTLREGLESVMTDGAVDVGKVERAQRELTLLAQAAEEVDARLLAECGVGLCAG